MMDADRTVSLARPIKHADLIEGMVRGLRVLEGFGAHRQRLNVSQAAARAELPRASARRHLLTLVHLGYLESDGHWYWLTPKVLRLSGDYLASARLPRLTQSWLDRLSVQTGCAVSVVVSDGDAVVVVARSLALSAPPHPQAHGVYLGARLPLHATSTGKLVLASWRKEQFDAWLGALDAEGNARQLLGLTPYTITHPRKLRAEIARVRRTGWCLSSEQHEPGVHAIAVPLVDLRGHLHAALNLIAPPRRSAPQQHLLDALSLLQSVAGELRMLL